MLELLAVVPCALELLTMCDESVVESLAAVLCVLELLALRAVASAERRVFHIRRPLVRATDAAASFCWRAASATGSSTTAGCLVQLVRCRRTRRTATSRQ